MPKLTRCGWQTDYRRSKNLMDNGALSVRYIRQGAFFQINMLLFWFLHGTDPEILNSSFHDLVFTVPPLSLPFVVRMSGFVLMVYCMVRIYLFHQRPTKRHLITTDVFALTRHPMYHGIFLADIASFWQTDVDTVGFWAIWAVFVGCLLAAGWFQEKETLARWGDEARQYYARTPRFIWQWLWFRRPNA